MEQHKHKQQQICSDSIIYDGLPPISSKYPCLVAQNLDTDQDVQFFYNLNDPLSNYHCRIPELLGKRIRGCFHGWLILSDYPHHKNLTLSLWNPNTSKVICLPPLILKDGDYESIGECCLSSPPDDPSSILLLKRTNKPTFVFLRLNCKRNKLRWIEMSYDKQLKRITGKDGLLVYSLACCNGKVYALNTDNNGISTFIIKVDILVKDRQVLIKLSLFGLVPPILYSRDTSLFFLKGSSSELFYIEIDFSETQHTPCAVELFKLDMAGIKKYEKMECLRDLDMTSTTWMDIMEDWYSGMAKSMDMWEEIIDLKDAIFFVDVSRDCSEDVSRDRSVFYSSTISSKFGGFIYIRGVTGDIIYSYHVKKRTLSLSTMSFPVLPKSHVSMWECRLEDDLEEAKYAIDSKQEEEGKDREIVVESVTDQQVEFNESQLLNLPFPILEMIMKLCVCSAYMNFRATCKLCHFAAPLIPKSHERCLQTYSLVSPWLVVVDKNQGILTFTDPIFGGNYYMKNLQVSIHYRDEKIFCSRFGWFFFYSTDFSCLVSFNPFTSEFRKLPETDDYHHFDTVCFSAPPTSPEYMVVGFLTTNYDCFVSIYFVALESSWRTLGLGPDPHTIRFPTFKDGDLFALGNEGKLIVFKDLDDKNYSWKVFEAQVPRGCCKSLAKYYLMTCDQHLLLVVVGEFGEHVEVFKWNDVTEEWEKIDSLGRHVIFIGGTTCICIEAKIREMENKIYFPRLHSENGKIVFYSLQTCMYHTFDGDNNVGNFKDFIGLDCHLNPHAWIEPTWS